MLKDYHCEILYHPGKANVVADALSRKATHPPAIATCLRLTVVTPLIEMIRKAQIEGRKKKNHKGERLRGYYKKLRQDSRGLWTRYGRIWVPYTCEARQTLMDEAHKSKFSIHPGATKMYRDLRENYWWPGMKRDVVWYVERCLTCSMVKTEHQKPHGKLRPLEIPLWKWEDISMDLITKLPQTQKVMTRSG